MWCYGNQGPIHLSRMSDRFHLESHLRKVHRNYLENCAVKDFEVQSVVRGGGSCALLIMSARGRCHVCLLILLWPHYYLKSHGHFIFWLFIIIAFNQSTRVLTAKERFARSDSLPWDGKCQMVEIIRTNKIAFWHILNCVHSSWYNTNFLYSFMLLFQDRHKFIFYLSHIVYYFLYKCNGVFKATLVILQGFPNNSHV